MVFFLLRDRLEHRHEEQTAHLQTALLHRVVRAQIPTAQQGSIRSS